MKRTEIDRVMHSIYVLERKINAYNRVRRAISELASELRDDPYALEVLLAVDKAIFVQMRVTQQGLNKLRARLSKLESTSIKE